MKQLLAYGIKLGETGRVSEDPAQLEGEAIVRLQSMSVDRVADSLSHSGSSTS